MKSAIHREGPRIVSSTKVSTFLCVKRNGKWTGRNVGLTYACFHCSKDKVVTEISLNLISDRLRVFM